MSIVVDWLASTVSQIYPDCQSFQYLANEARRIESDHGGRFFERKTKVSVDVLLVIGSSFCVLEALDLLRDNWLVNKQRGYFSF